MKREPTLLESCGFDVLIVGGGIVGCAIARDAALRGIRVALVEKGDFASGTSSRTSKLVHGGLRYLEHGYLGLVRESCLERQRLLKLAPHLVKPLRFLLPFSSGSGWLPYPILRMGLYMYDIFAGGTRIGWHHGMSAAELARWEPALAGGTSSAGASYYDAVMDDARVTLEVALAATQAGAVLVNHAEAVSLLRSPGGAVAGAAVRDQFDGTMREVPAKLVVNAGGPWGDGILGMAGRPGKVLRPTKGVHLIMRKQLTSSALIVRAREDQRVFFVIPWQGLTIIGTTDTDYSGDLDDIRADGEDVRYLLEHATAVLPGARFGREDILCTYAGVRPLLAGDPKHPSATSREHRIWEEPRGMLSVLGGKFTTFRAMAEQAVNAVERAIGVPHRPSPTLATPLPGAVPGPKFAGAAPEGEAARLAAIYGERASEVLAISSAVPHGFSPLCQHTGRTRGEVAYAVQAEMAMTLSDILERRLRLALTTACRGSDAAETAAMVAAPLLKWDEEERKRHINHYLSRLETTKA